MSALGLGRPAALAPADFALVRDLVRARSGIVLEDGKEYLVEGRLAPLARAGGLGSVGELVQVLRAGRDRTLPAQVVDAMTTNETSFFRDVHPFAALREVLLPELVERRRARRRLAVWCAAASSGQEPYSLAMVLRDHFPELRGWEVRILATDLSPSMVARTREGRFSALEVSRGLPADLRDRHMVRDGDGWRVRPELRGMVEARELNLAEAWPAMPTFDLVLLRNVLIYFDQDLKRRVLAGVRRRLAPDGSLLLGSSEATFTIDEGWVGRTVGRTIVYGPRQQPGGAGPCRPT